MCVAEPWMSSSSKPASPPESFASMSPLAELVARQKRKRTQRLFMRKKLFGLMERLLPKLQQSLLEIDH